MLHLHLHPLVLSLLLVPPAAPPFPTAETVPEPPNTIYARETEQEPLAIHLELDLSKLPAQDVPYFERDIQAAIDPLLAREPLVLADDAAHRLVIHVELLDPATLDYAIDFELFSDGSLIQPSLERLYCRVCPQVEVVEQVTQGLPGALAAVRAAAQPTPIAPEPDEPLVLAESSSLIASPIKASTPPDLTAPLVAPRAAPAPPIPPTPSPRIRWLGPVGAIGIVLALGGVTTVTLGTITLRQSWESTPDPRLQLTLFSRDPDVIAWLLYGTGLAVTAIGGAMLAADVTTLRQRRARRLAARASLTPTHAGLVIHGRF